MSTVNTLSEQSRLNAEGTYGPYRAANGHIMVARLVFPRDFDVPCHNCHGTGLIDGEYVCGFCKGKGSGAERPYKIGDEIKYNSFSAWCDSSCYESGACGEGLPLEDW